MYLPIHIHVYIYIEPVIIPVRYRTLRLETYSCIGVWSKLYIVEYYFIKKSIHISHGLFYCFTNVTFKLLYGVRMSHFVRNIGIVCIIYRSQLLYEEEIFHCIIL